MSQPLIRNGWDAIFQKMSDLVPNPETVDFDVPGLTAEDKRLAWCWIRHSHGGPISSDDYDHMCAMAREKFGIPIQPRQMRALARRNDFRAYIRRIGSNARRKVLERLDREAFEALDDYLKTRRMAMEQGDYKEARLAAADHLDRIGATRARKETPNLTIQTVVLRGRHFDAATIDAPTPTIESAEIVPDDDRTT